MNARGAAEFVALVTDGIAIDGYGVRCDKCGQPTEASNGRKAKFLKLGRAVMKDLAKSLGIDPKKVNVNPAGPAVSGDVSLMTNVLRAKHPVFVHFSHRLPREHWGDFFARYGDARYGRDQTLWMRWEELCHLSDVAAKIKSMRVDP